MASDDAAPWTPDAAALLEPAAEPEQKYHTFAEVEAAMSLWVERHPGHAAVITYGQSTQGRPLYAIKISDRVDVDENEPKILINFGIHGDEIVTAECALLLLHGLIERYGWDPRVTALVDNLEIFVVPVMNPDGFSARTRTADGVDPNREFPDANNPDRASIGIVTAARAFFEGRDFAGTLDVHGGGRVVLLPFGASFDDPANLSELTMLGQTMASAANERLGIPFTAEQISDWRTRVTGRPTTPVGGTVDYYHWKRGQVHLGLELVEFQPALSDLYGHTSLAVEIAMRFLEHFVTTGP